jgi:hypothetical protein
LIDPRPPLLRVLVIQDRIATTVQLFVP